MAKSGGDLAKRVAVAGVGIPITVALAYLGGYGLAVLIAVFASVAAWEFGRMYRAAGLAPGAVVSAILALAYVFMAASLSIREYAVWATVMTLGVGAVVMIRAAPDSPPGLTTVLTLFGAVYTGVLLSFCQLLRNMDGTSPSWRGAAIVFLPVAITWIGDSAAYFVGRAIGRHKFAPVISPKKTWEGAVAGFAAAVLSALLWAALTEPLVAWTMSWAQVAVFGAAVSVAGQVGDLFESRFKRDCGVKDSSSLLPGHGGFLDRVDALLFVFPIAYAYLAVVGI